MRLPKFRLQSLSAIARGLRSHQEMRRAGDKNTKRRSSRPPAWLLVVLALLVALFVVSAKSASPPQQSNLGERAQSGAAISTDRDVYVAGETVNVFGSGFSPYERVGLRVTHANGNRESNMGHEMWWTNAEFEGTFKAAWTVNSGDSGGARLHHRSGGLFGFQCTGDVRPRRSYEHGWVVVPVWRKSMDHGTWLQSG